MKSQTRSWNVWGAHNLTNPTVAAFAAFSRVFAYSDMALLDYILIAYTLTNPTVAAYPAILVTCSYSDLLALRFSLQTVNSVKQ